MGSLVVGEFLLLSLLLFVQPRPGSERQIFLGDTGEQQGWCAYQSLEAFNRADFRFGGVVAKYHGAHLFALEVTETDESGDWTRFDKYEVAPNGEITKLVRRIDFLSDAQKDEEFIFVMGAVVQHRVSTISKTTNRPTSEYDGEIPVFPVAKNIRGFPFAPLLQAVPRDCFAAKFRGTSCSCRSVPGGRRP